MKRFIFTQPHGKPRMFLGILGTRGGRACTSKYVRAHRRGAGFTLAETLIIGALFGLFLIVGSVILSAERARTRDAKRIADMTRLASGFAVLYAEKASFAPAAAGCPKVGGLAASCSLTPPVTGLDAVVDPGRFHYTVSRVPDKDDFGIAFRLERRYGSLVAGPHVLSKNGVR